VHLVRSADEAGARRDLEAGLIDAVIEVPSGFGATIPGMATGGSSPTLHVLTDANKQIAGDVARSIADGVGARIGTSVLAIATALDARGDTTDAVALQRIVEAGQQVSSPIAVAQVDVGGRYPPVAYFGASMGILFLFFTVGAGARSLITERKEGTLDRMRVAPVTDSAVLFGTALGVFIIGLASLLTIWAITSVVFRASWGDPVAVLAILVASVVAVAGISALVGGLARTDAQADGLTAVVAFVFALLGGSFLQPGSLPGLLDQLTLVTPNGWALRGLTRVGAGGAGLADVLPNVLVLLVIGAVTATIGVQAMRTRALT
jgi:ABC-2 type transport system permease protein